MKDYRLSEMDIKKAIKILDDTIPPSNNKMVDFAHFNIAVAWEVIKEYLKKEVDNIEPRDMIDLPCINIATVMDKVKLYEVHYRDKKTNAILTKTCKTEAEADAFLAELKEKK